MNAQVIYPGTLADALQSPTVLPGSRLLLRGGTYLVGDMQCKLTNVTITNYPGEQATLRPSSGTRILQFGTLTHDVIVDGIVLDGANVSAECIKITEGAQNVTVRNCDIKNAKTFGILISKAATTGTMIKYCLIHDIGTSQYHHGVYLSDVGDTIVEDNEIHACSSHGIHIYGTNELAQNIMIRRNYIHDNDHGIGHYYGTVTIVNNVLRNQKSVGLRVKYEAIGSFLYHNTVTGSGDTNVLIDNLGNTSKIESKNNVCLGATRYGFACTDLAGPVALHHNLSFGSGISDYTYDATEYLVDKLNNIVAAFIPCSDDDAANIKPTAGNPAISAGVAVTGITTDYGGNARANPPTIGAWE